MAALMETSSISTACVQGLAGKFGPRLRECCGQGKVEVVSNSWKIVHKTWGPSFGRSLCVHNQSCFISAMGFVQIPSGNSHLSFSSRPLSLFFSTFFFKGRKCARTRTKSGKFTRSLTSSSLAKPLLPFSLLALSRKKACTIRSPNGLMANSGVKGNAVHTSSQITQIRIAHCSVNIFTLPAYGLLWMLKSVPGIRRKSSRERNPFCCLSSEVNRDQRRSI